MADLESLGLTPGAPSGGGGRAPGGNGERAAAAQQQDERVSAMLSQIMTSEARERLQRIKLVKPEKAEAVERKLLAMAQRGLGARISEQQLIEMMEGSGAAAKTTGKITIQRKGAIDSSSDEEFSWED